MDSVRQAFLWKLFEGCPSPPHPATNAAAAGLKRRSQLFPRKLDSWRIVSGLWLFSVSAHVGGPHGRRLVIPDERQHHHQRLHRSHTQGLERGDRRMYPHPLRAYLNRALHAPP